MARDGIAIVGMSVLLPGAPDLSRYWSNLVDGFDAIRDVPPGRLDPVFFDAQVDDPGRFYCRRGGFVDDDALFDPLSFGIMPVVVDAAEPDQMIALRVASEALRDAGPSAERVDRTRVAVILGRGGYLTQAQSRLNEWVRTSEQVVACLRGLLPELSEAQLDEVRQRFQQTIGPRRPEAAIGIVPNLAASRIANRLDFSGPAYLVDAACASSLIAVDHAVRELESGRCDLVLAGGVHHCHDTTLWSVFTQLRAVSPSQQIRPFDRRADGLLIGEGTGIIVLKRLADAERDGDRIYAVVRGTGLASDGRESALMNPSVSGQVLALERAWRAAGVDPASIGLVEAHGTATPAGDEAELRTLAQFFGPAENGRRATLGTVKSMIGHAMPAAGIAGLVKAALAVHHGVLLPTLHCEEPLPLLEQTRFRPLAKAEPWETAPGAPRRAGVNAFGFGGVNAHVVLESHAEHASAVRAARVPRSAATSPAESEAIWLFAAASPAELLEQLDAARESGAPPPLGASRGPARLAIAGPDPKRIEMARKAVERGRAWRGRGDIWFAREGLLTSGGRLAFLFPGIEPLAVPELDDVAAHLGLAAPELGGGDLELHGHAVVEAGRFLDRALRGLGVAPDLMAGHSIGEWSGMIASEMVPPAEIGSFIESLERNRLVVPDVVYLAAGCSAETAQQVIADIDGVALSHDNCPHQAIVCGRSEAVERVRQRLREQRILSEELSFRSGFHSTFFAPHLEHYLPAIERAPLQRPSVPLWSATTCELYPEDPQAIRDLLRRFYVEPVRFRPLLQRLHGEGVRVFVQLGIGSLMNFVSDTLRSEEHLAIALLERGRSGLAQLQRAAAALFVEGAEIDLERVLAGAPVQVQAAPARRGGKLVLGSNLVRFAEPLALARSVTAPPSPVAQGPLQAEFEAVLRQATEASREVAELFGRGSKPGAATTPAVAASGPRELRERRRLSVEAMPALIDHTLFPQPQGCDPSDRFPVAPMTAMIAMMGEAAQRLVPGLSILGYEKITALRWLAVEPPVEIEVHARFDGVDRVQVTLDRYARCVVRLGGTYPQADAEDLEPLLDPHPCPVQASDFYQGRWMFHGPRYQGVAALGPIADNGMRGTLRARPALGALLDNAGQLMGFWMLVYTTQDRFAFPFQIERIDFFGPEPPADTIVECEVRIDALTETSVRARMELRVGERLLARVRGWEDRRFETTERSWDVFMRPSTSLLAETDSRPYAVAREHWRTSAGRELVMRRYLGAVEREEYGKLDPNAQRDWLLARIAIKDAVRRWLWDRGHGPLFPLEIQVRGDGKGSFSIQGPFDEDLRVAVAHQRGIAVALLSVGTRGHIEIGASAGSGASLESRQESSFVVSWSATGR